MSQGQKRTVLFVGGAPAENAAAELQAMAARMGLPWAAVVKSATSVVEADLMAAVRVIAFEPVPFTHEKLEVWMTASDGHNVPDLVARLMGGKNASAVPAAEKPRAPKPPVHTVRIAREVAGRRGKGVTTVWDLPMNGAGIKDLAATLKQKCGTGGTVKDGKIEIQGDHRDKIEAELQKLGYKVKRSGG